MVNMSLQLSQYISDIFTSTANAVMIDNKIDKCLSELQLPEQQTPSWLLSQVFAQIFHQASIGAAELNQVNSPASILSFLDVMPETVAAIDVVCRDWDKNNAQEVARKSKDALIASCHSLKASLTRISVIKQANVITLLLNLPFNYLQSNAPPNIFSYIKTTLLSFQAADAERFYQNWMAAEDRQQQFIASFQQHLSMHHQETRSQPVASLAEVAVYFALLEPGHEDTVIRAYANLFKEMLFECRQALIVEPDCIRVLKDMTFFLIHLVIACGADRFFTHDQQGAIVINQSMTSAIAIILMSTIAIPVNQLSSIPLTLLHDVHMASTPLISITLAGDIIHHIRRHAGKETYLSLITPETLSWFCQQDTAPLVLNSLEKKLRGLINEVIALLEKIERLQQTVYGYLIEIESNPIYHLHQLFKQKKSRVILKDKGFFAELSALISRGLSRDEIINQMNQRVQTAPVSKLSDIPLRQNKMALLDAMSVLLSESDQINCETLMATAKQNKLIAYLQSRVKLAEKEIKGQEQALKKLKAGDMLLGNLVRDIDTYLLHLRQKEQIINQQTGDRSQHLTILLHVSRFSELLMQSTTELRCILTASLKQMKAAD